MAIASSSEVIREMKAGLQTTLKDIERTHMDIKKAAQATEKWNDAQGRQYRELLKRIAAATASPSRTLRDAVPKLESLARTLDAYGRVKF